ncbi:helix-turn-helix transcriptional regulator [Rhodoferax sp. GW822-FHT02A01]|uniref:helix-turn-helix domain-containing protein n=1 Tax=Rhodoferax sp. GW822-FHT02A01 TaxID=3141537 RepID=UPI00315C8B31
MKEPLRKKFAARVKAIRHASGMSQEAFADKCGFARSYMSRIERGGANPSLDALETIAEALGIEVKALFESASPASAKKKAAPITVPFAADGTCFNPSLKRKRTGRFTVGEKGHLIDFDDFEAALAHLKAMKQAYWLRPNSAGNWGIVTAVRWDALPKK